jgi:hypothetical protein
VVPTCDRHHFFEIDRDPKCVLEDNRLGSRGDAALELLQVHVVGVESTVDIDRSRTRVTDGIRNHDVRRHLKQNLVPGSDTECSQRSVQADSSGREAHRVTDADLLCERSFVVVDGGSLNQVRHVEQIPEAGQAVAPVRRSAEKPQPPRQPQLQSPAALRPPFDP